MVDYTRMNNRDLTTITSRRAASLMREQEHELEMTAKHLREHPQQFDLDPNEAQQVADIFQAAASVFYMRRH